MIGQISKRPINIANDKTILDKSENIEKLLKGPAKPKPGPTLPIHVKQAESVVSKSKSSKDTINNIDPNINIKQKKQLSI